MKSEVLSLIICNVAFFMVVFQANKDFGKLEGKNYNIHVFLSWLLLISHNSGFRVLGWACGHPESILAKIFIPIGPLPDWYNLSSWAGGLFGSIIAIVIAFALIRRKERARQWLLRLIPILFLFDLTESLKGFYIKDNAKVTTLFIAIIMVGLLPAILYCIMYVFYSKDKVKNYIFRSQPCSKFHENTDSK
ncbi:MAG: hypothetical protein KJ826_17775 [Proteobacteria bacterium]|nr:hypothetical protein [Pseudomonadota bacterium]MBU4037380.1 hypothetical protein [Pseudomonadota bacterium]